MRYIDIAGEVIPKHCIYGPRPAEGLVFRNYEWWRITDHLVKEQREREIAALSKAKEEAKKNLSFKMTSNWSNTLASIKTQGNQKRAEKMKKEKQDRIDQYHEIIKNRKEEKRELLKNVKKIIFNETDPVKTINSAVWYSTVYDEWNKQVEKKNQMKSEKAREEKELGLKFQKDAEDFKREKFQEALNKKAQRMIQKKLLDEQMEDIRQRRKIETEEFEREKEDMKNMVIEGERIHRCNMVERDYRKKFAARYSRKTDGQIEYERKLALEQEEEDEINKIYEEYTRRFKKERKDREEKIKNEAVERRVKIAEIMAQKMAESALKEEESYTSAVREKEEQAKREEEDKKEQQRQALHSLLEGKRKAEETKARKIYEEKEKAKWEMMQQYRSAEINEEWKQEQEKLQKETQRKVIAALDCQRKQMEEKRAKDLQEWLEPLGDEAAEREEVRQYCEDTMKFIKENNLIEYPVRAAMAGIRELYGIEDKEQTELNEKRKQKQTEQQESRKSRPLGKGCYCLKY